MATLGDERRGAGARRAPADDNDLMSFRAHSLEDVLERHVRGGFRRRQYRRGAEAARQVLLAEQVLDEQAEAPVVQAVEGRGVEDPVVLDLELVVLRDELLRDIAAAGAEAEAVVVALRELDVEQMLRGEGRRVAG